MRVQRTGSIRSLDIHMSSSTKNHSRMTSRSKCFRLCPLLLSRIYLCCAPGRQITELTDAKVEFGLIPHDDWFQPSWINETKATEARNDMMKNQVIYGGKSTSFSPLFIVPVSFPDFDFR